MAAVQQSADHEARGSASARYRYLDNLKVLLIAGVIVLHAFLSYVDVDLWPYVVVRETTLSPVSLAVGFALGGPFGLFLMALLFLVAGLLTPASLARKGAGRFARDRLLRLGVPFLVFALLLWPALLYALFHPLGHMTLSYGEEFRLNFPDNGPLWFVGVLLLLSLAYAAWTALRPARAALPRRVVTGRWLLGLALAIAVSSFVVHLWVPYGGEGPLDLNEWQWPECAGLFGLGVVASRQGWLEQVPRALARRCGFVAAASGVGAALYAASADALGIDFADVTGGLHWESLVFAALGGLLTVHGSVWLLALAQRRLDRELWHGPALARNAYAAFILQGVPLLGLAVLMRGLPLPAEAKALVLAVGGVVGSFALAALVRRVPGLSRVL